MGPFPDPGRTIRVGPPLRITCMSLWSDRLTLAAMGPASAAAGLAAGHLLAAVTTPSASPVLAVGSTVIDRTPTQLKEWAIAHFGTNDKTILVGSVVVVVLLVR